MARIGRNINLPAITTSAQETEVTSGSATGLSADQKFSLLIAVSIGFGVVCLLAMLAMLSSTWQFKSNTYSEYSNLIREYNDKRYDNLNKRVNELESKAVTQSGR